MPEFRGIKVTITTTNGTPFEEYGNQVFKRNNAVTCYIESLSNVSFQVKSSAEIPFRHHGVDSAHRYFTRSTRKDPTAPGYFGLNLRHDGERCNCGTSSDKHQDWCDIFRYYQPEKPIITDGRKESADQNLAGELSQLESDILHLAKQEGLGQFKNDRAKRMLGDHKNDMPRMVFEKFQGATSNIAEEECPPPDFHFLAELYLDGRSTPERRLVLYLDPKSADFPKPSGEIRFKTRWIKDKSGHIKERGWFFKDVGVDSALSQLDQLNLNIGPDTIYVNEGDILANALGMTALDEELKEYREKNTQGQIKIIFSRVVLGKTWIERDVDHVAIHEEGKNQEEAPGDLENDVTHTACLGKSSSYRSETVRLINYLPFKEGEEPWATFTFFYRSRNTLQKMPFWVSKDPRPGAKARARGRARELNSTIMFLTPLKPTALTTQWKPSEGSKKNPDLQNYLKKAEEENVFDFGKIKETDTKAQSKVEVKKDDTKSLQTNDGINILDIPEWLDPEFFKDINERQKAQSAKTGSNARRPQSMKDKVVVAISSSPEISKDITKRQNSHTTFTGHNSRLTFSKNNTRVVSSGPPKTSHASFEEVRTAADVGLSEEEFDADGEESGLEDISANIGDKSPMRLDPDNVEVNNLGKRIRDLHDDGEDERSTDKENDTSVVDRALKALTKAKRSKPWDSTEIKPPIVTTTKPNRGAKRPNPKLPRDRPTTFGN